MAIDKNLIGDLMRSGLSYPEIAERFGVSRQSIHQFAANCFPELAQEYAERRKAELQARKEQRRVEHFLKSELPYLVKEWLFEAGYARCMACEEWKSLALFPPSTTPYRSVACNPCTATRMKEYRSRVPLKNRTPGGWRTMTEEQREERIRASREKRWGT